MITFRGLVIWPETEEDILPAMEQSRALLDDRWWSRYVMQSFAWQRYINWWVARRWVQPRDIRRTDPVR